MKVLDLNAVISDTETMLRRTLGQDVRMTAIFASSLSPIRADSSKVQQVVLSLAARARQAMPKGGRFTIETKNVRIDRGSEPDVPPGPYVMLTLSDTGACLNESALRLVFHPALPAEPAAIGADLEMNEIPAILRQFGGYIHVESQAGQSAAFQIFLPCCDPPLPILGMGSPVGVTDAVRSPFALPFGQETVLLVNDHDSVRSLVKTVLQSSGYSVLEAASGDEAIHIADTYHESIDLVITDVKLPRHNTHALVDRLIVSQPALKVLMISGYCNDRLFHGDYNQPNVAILQKPFKCAVLGNIVRQVLDTPIKRARTA